MKNEIDNIRTLNVSRQETAEFLRKFMNGPLLRCKFLSRLAYARQTVFFSAAPDHVMTGGSVRTGRGIHKLMQRRVFSVVSFFYLFICFKISTVPFSFSTRVWTLPYINKITQYRSTSKTAQILGVSCRYCDSGTEFVKIFLWHRYVYRVYMTNTTFPDDFLEGKRESFQQVRLEAIIMMMIVAIMAKIELQYRLKLRNFP